MSGPLEGIRVVELGVWVAGPAAGGILADWGADVIKIEPPTGDPARTFQRMLGGDMASNPPFELDNRSKRSIVLDLGAEEGRGVARELIDAADVFVTNVRASALGRLGLDPDSLRARNGRLVYAIVTGYGMAGPDADRPAYDIAAWWARSGIASLLTPPGGTLPFQRGGMGDHTVAMTAAAMVSAALVARERTGEGQLVSTSLLRQGAYTISFDLNTTLMWGLSIGVGRREAMGNPSINNYTAGDGRRFWIVGLEGARHWPPLARAVGHPEWLDDERFAAAPDRARNAAELIAALDEVFATKSARRMGGDLRGRTGLLLGAGQLHRRSPRRRAVPRRRRGGRRARRSRRHTDGCHPGRLPGHALASRDGWRPRWASTRPRCCASSVAARTRSRR